MANSPSTRRGKIRAAAPVTALDLRHILCARPSYVSKAWAHFVAHFPISTIIHPTDFSGASMEGFARAMAFSLAARSRLYVLYVARDGEDYNSYAFPHVRHLLGLWGKIEPHEPPEAIETLTGVRVVKIAVAPGNISANAWTNSSSRMAAI